MIADYLKKLDDDRLWRIREISDLRSQFKASTNERERSVTSRAIVVFCYAHWEGYCSTCVHTLVDFLEASNLTYAAVPDDFVLGATSSALDRFRDKSDNLNSRLELVKTFKGIEATAFEKFDRKTILPRSNLNFDRLRFIFITTQLDVSPFLRHRIRLDSELVRWRHLIAHGEMFTLDDTKVETHTRFCEELLWLLKNEFENALFSY